MIKRLFLVLCLFTGLAATAACSGGGGDEPNKEPVKETVTITLSQKEIQVPAKGGTYSIDVATTGNSWQAGKTSSWLTLNATGISSPSGKLSISVEPNTGDTRSSSIVVSSGTESEKITLEQQGAFKVSKGEVMAKSGGDTFSLMVSGRKDWEATADQDWIRAGKGSDASLGISVRASEATATRTGTVKIVSGEDELTVTVNQESVEITDITLIDGYELVWHDEFNEGTELNPEHWTHEVQRSGWVNNELQNYVNGEYNGRRVTELSDGKLRIHCFKSGNVYSGRVYAHVNEGWKYGYIEARILLPKGKGTWPAFWMMPVEVDWANEGWPKCGEIDIMEEVGAVPDEVSSSLHAEGHNHTNGTQVTKAVKIDKAEGEFHTYAIKWTAENITTYVDGKELLSYDNDGGGVKNWPYDKPYYIILNLAWGGSWGGMNGVDESALPVSYVIDYVRVYQKK